MELVEYTIYQPWLLNQMWEGEFDCYGIKILEVFAANHAPAIMGIEMWEMRTSDTWKLGEGNQFWQFFAYLCENLSKNKNTAKQILRLKFAVKSKFSSISLS